MTRHKRRLLNRVVAVGAAGAVALLAGGQPAGAAPGSADVTGARPATATAVEVFTVPPAVPDQLADDVAIALETAEARAEADPTDLAPPYVDPTTGRIVSGVRASAASTKVAYAGAGIAVNATDVDDGNDDPTQAGVESDKTEEPPPAESTALADPESDQIIIPRMFYPRTPAVKYSLADLTAVQDEVLGSDVPGVSSLYAASVDAERNRVVVRASALTEQTRTALASRYGADKVAVFLTPGADVGATVSRDNDANPFYGGATVHTNRGTCTIGFSWTHEGEHYFLTAGHCTSANTDVRMPRYGSSKVGKVVRDNWNNSTGSVKLSGQSYYSGDLALVKMNSGWKTDPKMYVGGPNSSGSRVVKGVASRSPKYGDKYCTGGTTTGEQCGWKVVDTKVTIRYRDGEMLRNATLGERLGVCIKNGDSGGPVYSVSGGKVVAKGIISGGGQYDFGCTQLFTDIRLAEKALPGIVKKR
ncbi:S1 family peptidase [Micromonospora sp. KC213]|uniref:S1 family peptidase n=1 Tax=Micromonospora sp. KC213 TaxID=2530378 RepID=UPI0010456654|nr:S1 family peptidase [Micromonospora sp. KC213]TDC36675.1 trypsin-like serine protease [Micromonospora sp. KC213]